MYIGWIYSIGVTMYNLIPVSLKPNGIRYFKLSCMVTWLILIFFSFYYPLNINEANIYFTGATMMLLIGNIIFIVSFSAKMLESVIEGKIVNFNDY